MLNNIEQGQGTARVQVPRCALRDRVQRAIPHAIRGAGKRPAGLAGGSCGAWGAFSQVKNRDESLAGDTIFPFSASGLRE